MWLNIMSSIALLLLFFAPKAMAATYVVKPDGSGDYPTIQAAIDIAVNGDIIELTDGRFTGEGNRDIDFLGKAISVRSQSGVPDACIIRCGGGESKRDLFLRGFYFHSGEGPLSELSGLTIEQGYTDGCGGAIYCADGSSPTLTDIIFSDNTALERGGGLYCIGSSSPTLTHCTFSNNSGSYGGGMWCEYSSPTLTDVYFTENSAGSGYHTGGGAGFYNSSITLDQVHFSGNKAGYAAGLYCDCTTSVLTGCTFSGNEASQGCGGMFTAAYEIPSTSTTLTDCVFSGNSAVIAAGGLVLQEYAATIANCVFSGNTSLRAGGLYVSGRGTFSNCIISDNSALFSGGGVVNDAGSPEYIDCTFFNNSANDSGGAVSCINATTPTFTNCTYHGNSSENGSGLSCSGNALPTFENGIIAFGLGGKSVVLDPTSEVEFSCCDIFGNAGGDWVGDIADQNETNGNFSDDPLFCGPEAEDFTIANSSPCLDAPGCGLVGAWGSGCSGPTATERTSWGGVKKLFR